MSRLLCLSRGLAAVAILCAASPAFAERKQETIRQYTVKAEEFAARDVGKILFEEIGLLKSFLSEAQNFLAQDEEEELGMALDRVKVTAELIDAELARAEVEDAANKVKSRAESKEAELAKINEDIARLAKDRAAIEAGGGR